MQSKQFLSFLHENLTDDIMQHFSGTLIVINSKILWLFARTALGSTLLIPLVQGISRLGFISPQIEGSNIVKRPVQKLVFSCLLQIITQNSTFWHRSRSFSFKTHPEPWLTVIWKSLFECPVQNYLQLLLFEQNKKQQTVLSEAKLTVVGLHCI